MKYKIIFCLLFFAAFLAACSKEKTARPATIDPAGALSFTRVTVNGNFKGFVYNNVNSKPVIKLSFSEPLNTTTASGSISLQNKSGTTTAFSAAYANHDSTIVIIPTTLSAITQYTLNVSTALTSAKNAGLAGAISIKLTTAIDSANKFPTLTDDKLLDLVQQQTLKYFYDFGHPTSGLARERNTSGDVVTTGGSGFGVMALVTGVSRNFITRANGLAKMQTIVAFLKDKAQVFHGAYPHWMNGATGVVIPFSTQDDGADLVETAYLMQGLLSARQYFNSATTAETDLRADINTIYNRVEWDWFTQGGKNTLYWHWSPNYGWSTNMEVNGWDEALITYVMAAASATHPITKAVYDNGWAQNGSMKNGNIYYGIELPLGPAQGGPLFFSQYSFLGINPNGLADTYAAYDVQNKAHAMINYDYCVANLQDKSGYSADCWGLTASDIENGYTASAPTNDVGVIAPTAAIASLPYTPTQSMQALRFFYYKLGDKIWGTYGFYDAFNLGDTWFADSYLAIDQGPIIVMIENYRSGLLWNLFMSCPEVKTGMKNLGFTSPKL